MSGRQTGSCSVADRLNSCRRHRCFFFSRRRRHTRCYRDWSSDVCSSDLSEPLSIPSMPGHAQHTLESLTKEAREIAARGVVGFVLFAIPERKDPEGSEAWNPSGVAQRGLQALREELGDEAVLIADLCLDEYTDHGHCGALSTDGSVDNDRTLELYRKIAVVQSHAGADLVAPSGMMDGQVSAIRQALDDAGRTSTGILT